MSDEDSTDEINGVWGIRQRLGRSPNVRNSKIPEISNYFYQFTKSLKEIKNSIPKVISLYAFFVVFFIYASLFAVQIYLERYHHPKPLMISDIDNHQNEFIAERAMLRLMKLTDIGPRVAGSYENEVLAVKMLQDEISLIIKEANPVQKIELDVKKYSGSFPLRFLDGLTNVYDDVQNVVVKLYSRDSSPHSLLMNCHFDSVPDSPGGSDDGAGCAVLLEILDVLSKSDIPLEHNIIFLFNGAEENLMHGSHGFITQHHWAKEVRAFVNLEACGAGGREVLFQSGPNSPWIMEVYAKFVPHPFASSMAQEVFESGLIPGDTDFRVFRDFGNVSGLDFAWSTNGYVYHTKYDNVNQIPLGALQRTGENMLALAKGLANAEEMKDVSKHKEGNMIYFDVLGLYLIRWPEHVGTLMNIFTVILSVILLWVSISDAKTLDIKPRTYIQYLIKTFGVVLLGAACSILVVLCISGFLSLIGKSMSWYGEPIWLLFLYIIPSVITVMVVQRIFLFRFKKTEPSGESLILYQELPQGRIPNDKDDDFYEVKETFEYQSYISVIRFPRVLFQMYFDVYQICWTTVLLASVILKIRSGYIAWMWVFGPCLGNLILRLIKSPLRVSDWRFLFFLLASVSLPVIQHINMQVGCLALFIPIMGRSGASLNSEIVIALFANVTFGMLFAHINPLIILIKNPRKIFISLGILVFIAFILLLFTPLGFPYSGNYKSPRPQRYMILHTHRAFYDHMGKEIGSNSGYWIVDHDYNSPHMVKPFVPEVSHAVLVEKDCERYLYCGLPYLMPVLSFIRKTHWIPSHPPKIEKPTSLKVLSRSVVSSNVERITLQIKGPDHMGLIISPKTNVEFVQWSLNDVGPVKGPSWNGQETYFVYFGSSSDPDSWIVSLDFMVSKYNETLMNIALTSHFLHGPRKSQLSFKRMLAQFPPWTAVTSWTATYKSFLL